MTDQDKTKGCGRGEKGAFHRRISTRRDQHRCRMRQARDGLATLEESSVKALRLGRGNREDGYGDIHV